MALPRRSPPVLEAGGTRFLIVEARYYEDIATMLLEGAKTAFAKAGASFDLVGVIHRIVDRVIPRARHSPELTCRSAVS